MFKLDTLKSGSSIRAVNLTSAASTVIFAMVYGMIEHAFLTSPLGIGILEYPLSIHLGGQIYLYHVLLFMLAVLISFNPFFDVLLFSSNRARKKQAMAWGMGNILNFIWLEDVSYFALFGEWPKDVMTPLHLSFYGVVWWYPVLLGLAGLLYYYAIRNARRSSLKARYDRASG